MRIGDIRRRESDPFVVRRMKERGVEFGKPEILPVHHFLPPRVT
jgi:hypothetical protein